MSGVYLFHTPCRSRLDVNEASVRLGLDLQGAKSWLWDLHGDLRHDGFTENTQPFNMTNTRFPRFRETNFRWPSWPLFHEYLCTKHVDFLVPLPTSVILWLLTLTSKSINILNIHEPWLQLTHSLKHHHPSGPFWSKGTQHGKSFL